MSGMGERLIGMGKYRKSRAFSPEGFFECEGRGLKWLGEAQSQGGPDGESEAADPKAN